MRHPICDYFIKIFSDIISSVRIEENFDEVIYKWGFIKIEKELPQLLKLPPINGRDSLFLSLLSDEGLLDSYNPSSNDSIWQNIIDKYNASDIGANLNIELKIYKRNVENHISIYQMKEFVTYLKNIALTDFLSLFSKYLKPYIIFELQNDESVFYHSQSVVFVSKNIDNPQIKRLDIEQKEKILMLEKDLCCYDFPKYELIPEEFYFYDCEDNEIRQLFDKVLAFLCFLSIFDYIKIDESSFSFRLNGFKTLKNDFNLNSLVNFPIDIQNNKELYKIYKWIYTDGNTSDKINIARNIISLNLSQENLKLEQNVFDAIKSNYRIYEKENVERYLSVRKEISELLITLQNEINLIVDGFVNDFKKNIITILSLFISVIVVNVISNDDFIRGFSNNIILLIFGFLFISLCYLFYSRWELNQKTKLYEKHYVQIKQRYSNILSELELQGIFEDCNPNNDDSHASFINKQRQFYTVLWFLALVILFFTTLEIYNYNNGYGSYILNLFRYRFCNSY